MEFPILSWLIFLPTIGAAILYLATMNRNSGSDKTAKLIAIMTTITTFLLSLILWTSFNPNTDTMQFTEKRTWIHGYDIFYAIGVDGLSILFVILTTFLMPICIISSWHSIKVRVREYMMAFLLMETLILGVFCAQDFLLFYIFFEAVLIPMYLIIGIWGGKDRVYAAYKFFLYTLAGSLLLLIAIIYIYYNTGTTDIVALRTLMPEYDLEIQKWLWLAMFASFAVKVPMWPVHTWLPDAHVQAPTAGSVILAGVLLKLGGYGFLRFSLPMLPAASIYYADFVFTLSIIAVVYTSLVALMQDDMKKLIAYSSIAHMGFVTGGLFAFNQQGIEGAVFQMISHGLVSGALFLCVGVLYDRMHTKEIAFYSGLTTKMPKYAMHFMVFMLASVGLPATAGFIGEFMVLAGVFKFNKAYCALMATGMVLGAAYMLWLYARVMYGKIKNEKLNSISDLNFIEKVSFWPITVCVIIIGVYPSILLDDIHISANTLETHITAQIEPEPKVGTRSKRISQAEITPITAQD
jgi:NADH-quinone oxidoreductase subunit M